jgi:hypothetical protein
MHHHTSSHFWDAFDLLPLTVQRKAQENFELLKRNPRHPSLRFKKIGGLWSARVGKKYRAVAQAVPDGFQWVWIGTHNDYEKFIRFQD